MEDAGGECNVLRIRSTGKCTSAQMWGAWFGRVRLCGEQYPSSRQNLRPGPGEARRGHAPVRRQGWNGAEGADGGRNRLRGFEHASRASSPIASRHVKPAIEKTSLLVKDNASLVKYAALPVKYAAEYARSL